MRRFQVYCPCWTPELTEAWENAGFLCHAQLPADGGETLDVIFLPPGLLDIPWQFADTLRPKLFAIAGDITIPLPEKLTDRYDMHHVAGETLSFSIATRLEGRPEPPEWDVYRTDGSLTDTTQVKAVAASLYYYLLHDIMQETFEWCGHTFSVLGPV